RPPVLGVVPRGVALAFELEGHFTPLTGITASAPSTVAIAEITNRPVKPATAATSHAPRRGASACGTVVAMFMIPRSLPRVAALGSTCVARAWSTDRNAP